MLYLLAAIGIATIAFLLWRAFTTRDAEPEPKVIAPDDDPDFLRQLRNQRKPKPEAE